MVKALRKKFVIVTTSLMIVVFGGFLLINTLYNNYWSDLEIVGLLDWIAYSGVFTSSELGDSRDNLFLDMIEEERPIIGLLLDDENQIVSMQVIGATTEKEQNISINQQIIDKMCEYQNDELKVGHYYYSYCKTDQNTLLVLMDDKIHGPVIWWWIGIVSLVCVGVVALIGITFFLSRFVTEPAEQSLLREKRFISDASHELKTPLGAISINAQALEPQLKDNLLLKNIISESNRMSRLIEKLLLLSKLDESDVLDLEELSLSDLCDEMVLTYESTAFEKGVFLNDTVEPGITIDGNEDELRQLLVILFDNSLKNTEKGGRIELVCKREKKQALIEVSNTGHGINSEELLHIFERFYTTDSARNQNSFGLGLAIAKSIVERHGGTIEAYSEPDKLTVFRIII